MADEAVVRIILQDSGRAAGGGGSSAFRTGQSGGMDMEALKWADPRNIHPVARDMGPAREMMARMTEWVTGFKTVQKEVDGALAGMDMNKLSTAASRYTHWLAEAMEEIPEASAVAEPLINLEEEAKKTKEQLELLAASMHPSVVEARVAAELELANARKQLNQLMNDERKRVGLIQEPKGFDPAEVASQKRERERRGALVGIEYDRMYGEDEGQGSLLNDLMGSAGRMRGTIGGIFGTMTGAALDVVSGTRRRGREDSQWRKRADLLAEARAPEVFPAMQAVPYAKTVEDMPRSEDIVGSAVPYAKVADGGKNAVAMQGQGGTGAAGWKGGGSTMAAMGGPVALAFAAKEVIDTIGRTVVGAVRGAGELATGVLDPSADASRSVMLLADTTAKAGSEMAKISPVVGFTVEAFGEAGKAVAGLMRNIDQFATRYGEYSPLIAQQQAIVEIRQVMGDMRRAREAETSLARYVQLQGDLQQKFEDMKVKLLTKVLETLMPILQILEQVMPSDSLVAVIGALLTPLRAIAESVATITGIQVASDLNDRMRAVEDPTVTLLSVDNGQRNFGEAAGD